MIDITMPITPDMQVYKQRDAKKPHFEVAATFEENGVYETKLTFNLHTGTHIDFPLHTLKEGASSTNHDIMDYIGDATVFDLSHLEEKITLKDIADLNIEADDFIIFKTSNTVRHNQATDFVYLAHDAASYLADKGIRGVGIDALGIERNQPNHPTHDALLEKGIIILEGAVLDKVSDGKYTLMCFPMKIDNVEALPVRAFLQP